MSNMRIKQSIIIIMLTVLVSSAALAQHQTFYVSHAQGWHWYEIDVTPKQVKPKQTPVNPAVEMEALQTQLKEVKARAILYPTINNVRNYITLQNQISAKAHQFGQAWQQVLLRYPELDFSIQNPTAQLARFGAIDARKADVEQALREFSNQYGLFFFYRSTCPYCHRFAPVLKRLVERYNIALVPITLDGPTLPEFPYSKRDLGQALRFKVKVVPAVFAINSRTQKITPIGFGFMSLQELKQRIYQLMKQTKQANTQESYHEV